MHRLRIWIRAFFGFSRTESNAFIILLPLMLIVLFSEPVYRWWRSRRPYELLDQNYKADSIIASLKWLPSDSLPLKLDQAVAKPFPFDPNTADEQTFLKLGLRQPIAKRIIRYREKGGKFKQKETLLKVYGMDTGWFVNVKPFISIQPAPEQARRQNVEVTNPKEKEPRKILDINTADSVSLVKLYGIGPALSRRIRVFRDRLGGFVSMEQLKEVYGLDSIAFKELAKRFLVDPDFTPIKIKINEATVQQLRHPYIKWKEAEAIVTYRLQHGEIQSVDQLLEIKILTPLWLEKIRPYLQIN
jgi:competence protein ComEA